MEVLAVAIKRTFENRGMQIELNPVGLSTAFGNDSAKQIQWSAFLKQSRLTQAPPSLSEVVEELSKFFAAILVELTAGKSKIG